MMEESIVDRSWIARTPSPTRRDLVAVLFRRRRTFLVCFIAIFLAALLYAVLLPSYESQMKILVRRGRVDPPMELDLEYIERWSLWLDIRILALTAKAVLTGTGA